MKVINLLKHNLLFLPFTMLIVLMLGCVSKTIVLDGHRAWPKQSAFTILPREYTPEELEKAGIRTDGVYMHAGWLPQQLQDLEDRQYEDYKAKGFSHGSFYIRFWANGRIMMRLARIEKENFCATDADSFVRARLGYYQILPDGKIEHEMYIYNSGTWEWEYKKEKIQINNGEWWLKTGSKYKGEPILYGFRFLAILEMEAQPDW